MTLQIHLLGSAQLSLDGVPFELPYQRPLTLLVYLLLTRRPHSRQRLTDLLFDGPADPRAALRWNLSKLRNALGASHLVSNRREITFNLESDYWVDVECFEALAAGAQVDSLRQAMELYQGDFLEDADVRHAPRFEHWALAQRARLRGLALAALAQYETCRRVLAEELGVEPGLETVDLYQRIRAGDLARLRPAHPLLAALPPIHPQGSGFS